MPVEIKGTRNMTEKQRVEDRSQGLGGSEVGALLGLNKYTTPLKIFNLKLGIIEPDDLSDNDAVTWGNELEDVVGRFYAKTTGNKIRRRNVTFAHNDHNWARANLDFTIDGLKRILEIKTAGQYMQDAWGEEGTDEVPPSYYVQCCWYMMIMDYDSTDLAVLIGGRDFRVYHIKRDRVLEESLLAKAKDFWFNYVKKEMPPPPINKADIDFLYPKDKGGVLTANSELATRLSRIKDINLAIKDLIGEKEELAFKAQSAIKDNSIVVDKEGKQLVTWRKTKDGFKFDKDRFRIENKDLYKKYEIERLGHRRFLVK